MLTRRGLVSGLVGIIAAPAIVRIENIMPVKAIPPTRVNISKFQIKYQIHYPDHFEMTESGRLLVPGGVIIGQGDWSRHELAGTVERR